MKINSLTIQGYKSLRDVSMEKLDDLVVLIGENGSGKSNLLEALDLFFSSFNGTGGITPDLTNHLWYNKYTRNPIWFIIEIELDERELELCLGPAINNIVSSRLRNKMKKITVKRQLAADGNWTTEILQFDNNTIIEKNTLTDTKDWLSALNVKWDLEILELEIEPTEGESEIKQMLVTKEGRTRKYVSSVSDEIISLAIDGVFPIKSEKTKDYNAWVSELGIPISKKVLTLTDIGINDTKIITDKFSELVRTSFGTISSPCTALGSTNPRLIIDQDILEDITTIALGDKYQKEREMKSFRTDFEKGYRGALVTKGNTLLIDEDGRSLPIPSMGGGHQSWFRLLRKLKQSAPILTIEEPETHFHPGLCKQVFEYIKEKTTSKQIFITTHSPIFIDREKKESNWIVEFRDNESHIYRTKDFILALDAIGASPSDRLMPDSILLVEGWSDKAFIVACAEKMKVKLTDLRIVPIHGKSKAKYNFDAWIPVVSGTQICLHLLLDRDAKCEIEKLVKRGIVQKGDYSLLDGEIEDTYPAGLVKTVMKEIFNVDIDPMDPLSPPRKDYLEEMIPDRESLEIKWNVQLAVKIGKKIKKSEIPKEIVDILESVTN